MKNHRLVYLWPLLFYIVSCNPAQPDDGKTSIAVSVNTGEVTEIESSSAKLNGTCSIKNAEDAKGTAFFYYSSTVKSAKELKKSGLLSPTSSIDSNGGNFSSTIASLNPDTKYYYMAAISIDGEDYYSRVLSFSTIEKPKGLTITGAALEITEYKAILSGYANLTPDLGDVTMGILCSKDENPTLDNSLELTSKELDGNNMYTVLAQNLDHNTTYYYKSFVCYGGIYRFGEVRSFTTRDFEVLVKTEKEATAYTFRARFNGSYSIDGVEHPKRVRMYFLYDTEANSIEAFLESKSREESESTSGNINGKFSLNTYHTLKHNTIYYYVACVEVDGQQYYGEVLSIITNDFKTISSVTIGDLGARIDFRFIYEENDPDLELLSTGVYLRYGTKPDRLSSEGVYPLGDCSFIISPLNYNTTYYYSVFFMRKGAVLYERDVESFTTKDFCFDAIDMGLSVKWGNANLGSTVPEEPGDFYSWGELTPKNDFNNGNYKWNGLGTKSKYNQFDNKTTLELTDDAANVRLGGKWRMPTYNEIAELLCDGPYGPNHWMNYHSVLNGQDGVSVTYIVNGNTIFIPYAQIVSSYYYDPYSPALWSSSKPIGKEYDDIAWAYHARKMTTIDRYCGMPIRPVEEK